MDYQALGVGLAAVITAIGAVVTGLITGSNGRHKDENDARIILENAENQRQVAVEVAGKARIEALVQDADQARDRARKTEEDADRRVREARKDAQRGWDLASHHFGVLSVLAHLLNNVFTVAEISEDDVRLRSMVKSAQKRMATMTIPESLESIGNTGDTAA